MKRGARKREGSAGGVIGLLLLVVALAAMAEVVAGRPAATAPEAPRVTSATALLRLGDEARARGDVPAARRAYLAGLFRARGEDSLADVVWAAEGFAALGDHAVVEQALALAAPLAARGDDATRARLAALHDRVEPVAALPAFWEGAP
ncbi:MAG TPA: hypothetical protein VMQ51_00445 [Candidatus Binatia bacterium]|nr:hypothetical protein [Candidatus Binatia bacterium]